MEQATAHAVCPVIGTFMLKSEKHSLLPHEGSAACQSMDILQIKRLHRGSLQCAVSGAKDCALQVQQQETYQVDGSHFI